MKRALYVIMSICLLGCSSSKNEEVNKKSSKVHETAIAKGKALSLEITSLEEKVATLEDPQKTVLTDSIRTIKSDFSEWDELMAESPMLEVDHDDHSGHDHAGHNHDHGDSHDLTPEMVLDIQQDLLSQIDALSTRVKSLSRSLQE